MKSSDSRRQSLLASAFQFAAARGAEATTSLVADEGRMFSARKHLCTMHFA